MSPIWKYGRQGNEADAMISYRNILFDAKTSLCKKLLHKAEGTSLEVVFSHILRGCEQGKVAITAVSVFLLPPLAVCWMQVLAEIVQLYAGDFMQNQSVRLEYTLHLC